MVSTNKQPSFYAALMLLVAIFLVFFIGIGILNYPVEFILIVITIITGFFARYYGAGWKEILQTFIEKIKDADIKECVHMVATHFDFVFPYPQCTKYLLDDTNFDISVKLVLNDKIIGCYLLAEHDLKYVKFKVVKI